jgi:two-component system, cell cycle response regulator DivK
MTTASGQRRRLPFVLVADDDRDTRELYRACFDTNGYKTGEAATGSQALAAAVEIVPDVLLTDHILPDLDGVTVSRRLKQDARTAGVRIVMVTGHATPGLERRAADAGIERVLLKPCTPQTVMREVSRVLARDLPASAQAPTSAMSLVDRPEPSDRPSPVERIRGEFAALPGLALTAEQARLVFDLDRPVVDRILDALVVEGFLARTPQGAFKRPR